MARRLLILGLLVWLIPATYQTSGSRLRATGQTLSLIPTMGGGSGIPEPFFAACENMGTWPTVLGNTTYLGITSNGLDSASDQRLASCFQNMNNAGVQLVLEIGVVKVLHGCPTGAGCFEITRVGVQRLIDLGASLGALVMDEPLFYGVIEPPPGTGLDPSRVLWKLKMA
jgi:hypothetical protein